MKHIVFDCDGTLLDTTNHPYRLYPGIKELLLDLSVDCTLYVWTARGRSSTLRALQDAGVSHLFTSLYTADDGVGKPYIAGLVNLVGEMTKQSVMMIGDTTNDILGANNYGIKSIGVLWNGEANALVLKEAGADFIATEPLECSKLIRLNLPE